MKKEIEFWRPIPSTNNYYEASNLGRVRRAKTGRVLKPYRNIYGYLSSQISINGNQKRILNHRLVAEAFLGPCPSHWQVNHLNGIKADNRINNLEYCTHAENIRHSRRVLNREIGETHHETNLTNSDIDNIRRLNQCSEMSQKEIAKIYDISPASVNNIIRYRKWKHLLPPSGFDKNKKRPPRGETHGCSKLKTVDVKNIRSKYQGKRGEVTQLAKEYNVTITTISEILLRKTWRHI